MFNEDVYTARVKSVTGHVLQQSYRVFAFHPLPIRAVATGGIVEIHHRDNSRYQGNSLGSQPFGVTRAVPFFMVIANDVFYWIREVNSLKDIAADCGMNLH